MPIYPFVILAVLIIILMIVPPLLAAYVDMRREASRAEEPHGPRHLP